MTTNFHVIKITSDFKIRRKLPVKITRKISCLARFVRPSGIQINDEITEIAHEIDYRSSHINLNKLYKASSEPHPIFTHKDIEEIKKSDVNHDEIISNHINNMKINIEKLQEITQSYNCMESYKKDIEYLMDNIRNVVN